MIFLINKDCVFCDKVKDLDLKFPEIKKFFVEDGKVNMNGALLPLQKEIPALPCLIAGNTVYCGEKYILEFLEKSKED